MCYVLLIHTILDFNEPIFLIFNILNKEVSSLFSKNILIKGTTLIIIALFLLILINNITRNYPYTYLLIFTDDQQQ